MPLPSLRLFSICIVMATVGAVLTPRVHAASQSGIVLAAEEDIIVHDAWARASAGAATTGAAYLTLLGGDQSDTLTGVSTPVAATAEVHETINDQGVMKMRPVAEVPIPAHEVVTFAPGGFHIMLTGLKKPLAAGQSFMLTLRFAHRAPLPVDVQVRAMGDKAAPVGHDHMKM